MSIPTIIVSDILYCAACMLVSGQRCHHRLSSIYFGLAVNSSSGALRHSSASAIRLGRIASSRAASYHSPLLPGARPRYACRSRNLSTSQTSHPFFTRGTRWFAGASLASSTLAFAAFTIPSRAVHNQAGSDDMAPIATNGSAPKKHKVVIIGSGPAGHTAAIYLARAELKPVLFEGMLANGIAAGGQLTTTTEVENFPGFPDGIRGPEIMDKFRAQSIKHGTEIFTETISKVDLSSRPFKFWREFSEDQQPELADTIIMATGASARRMNLPGEETYWQSGISACAVCDGAVPIFRNKPLVVIGGGDSAAEEATYLTKYASHVYVLVRRDELRASKIMAKRLINHPKVTVLFNHVALEAKGDGELLKQVRIKDIKSNEERDLDANGLFYAIGHVPATDLVRGQVQCDGDGYIITNPGTSQTSVKGLFAAGDVQDKKYRQAVTSAGSGCIAALEAERLLAEEEEYENINEKDAHTNPNNTDPTKAGL